MSREKTGVSRAGGDLGQAIGWLLRSCLTGRGTDEEPKYDPSQFIQPPADQEMRPRYPYTVHAHLNTKYGSTYGGPGSRLTRIPTLEDACERLASNVEARLRGAISRVPDRTCTFRLSTAVNHTGDDRGGASVSDVLMALLSGMSDRGEWHSENPERPCTREDIETSRLTFCDPTIIETQVSLGQGKVSPTSGREGHEYTVNLGSMSISVQPMSADDGDTKTAITDDDIACIPLRWAGTMMRNPEDEESMCGRYASGPDKPIPFGTLHVSFRVSNVDSEGASSEAEEVKMVFPLHASFVTWADPRMQVWYPKPEEEAEPPTPPDAVPETQTSQPEEVGK
ncbi:uncharacterized protein MKK02DRAFT_43442 [Dioszegia hungarica]|uniref:Uncharacterized protein n=1 Tax=Dioszegia hungarica TaxID=4972 RepID=A0AA38HAB2_9TREE|nr:uncharacterized protein MKK02DRAFT_43442 [Dioszegia hungarica]KAI9637517.1 hypothetical protein MKK02DRAFT_43442 [Dioszegia hungarica]